MKAKLSKKSENIYILKYDFKDGGTTEEIGLLGKLSLKNCQALEILGDKKFTEEDMRYAWEYGNSLGMTGGAGTGDFENYLHREYPQYYEWDVEIEMEFVEEEQTGTHLVWGRTTPKLDADGCLILKTFKSK